MFKYVFIKVFVLYELLNVNGGKMDIVKRNIVYFWISYVVLRDEILNKFWMKL